jgi:hypothetical protein
MSDTRLRYLTALGVAATLAGACNQMLGIDDAHVDARLTNVAHGAGSSAGTSSSGGMGANGGAQPSGGGSGGSTAGAPAAGHNHGAEPGVGGSDGGNAGAEETPSAGKGGTGTVSMGGTHSGSGSAGKMSDEHAGEGGDGSGHSGDPCDDYCDGMQSECTGVAEQYHDRAQCMKICHYFPLGDSSGKGDGADENSVTCRLKYVEKMKYGLGAEVTNYCRQAGPSGDGTCGTPCQSFCSVMMQVCTEDNAEANHFASEAECLAACDALPAATVHYSDTDPSVSDGNHALCRIFHVNSAAMADPLEHCEHAMGHTLCEATP